MTDPAPIDELAARRAAKGDNRVVAMFRSGPIVDLDELLASHDATVNDDRDDDAG